MVKDKSNPDKEYNKAGKVCTSVQVTKTNDRTLQLCLTATTLGPGCRGSAVGGILAGVFFDSTPFGVQDSRELNIENLVERVMGKDVVVQGKGFTEEERRREKR